MDEKSEKIAPKSAKTLDRKRPFCFSREICRVASPSLSFTLSFPAHVTRCLSNKQFTSAAGVNKFLTVLPAIMAKLRGNWRDRTTIIWLWCPCLVIAQCCLLIVSNRGTVPAGHSVSSGVMLLRCWVTAHQLFFLQIHTCVLVFWRAHVLCWHAWWQEMRRVKVLKV